MRTIRILVCFIAALFLLNFGQRASASEQALIAIEQDFDVNSDFSHFSEVQKKHILAKPDKNPDAAIGLLLQIAGDEKRKGDYPGELSFLKQALSIYETNHTAEGCYYRFKDIRKEFERCERTEEGTEFLWRLVKRKMIDGFPDFEFPESCELTSWHADRIGMALFGKNAVGELLEMPNYQIYEYTPLAQEAVLFKLLDCARETRNSGNILYALSKLKHFYQGLSFNSINKLSKLADICEEMETWREVENNPKKRILGLLDSADSFFQNKEIQKSREKLKKAASVKRSLKSLEVLNDREFHTKMHSLQNDFLPIGRDQEAKELLHEINSGTIVTF